MNENYKQPIQQDTPREDNCLNASICTVLQNQKVVIAYFSQ